MKWNYVTKELNELKPQGKNPRRLSKKQGEEIGKSIERYGIVDPIIITKDNIIIGGHQRVKVLKQKKAKQVPCIQADLDLTLNELDELTIRLNKNHGEFDFDLLAAGYDPKSLLDWGFDMDELHLESIPEQEDKPKICKLTANFENEDDLREAETDIACIIDKYASAYYKVKIK